MYYYENNSFVPSDDEDIIQYSPAFLSRRASESWIKSALCEVIYCYFGPFKKFKICPLYGKMSRTCAQTEDVI